MRSDDHYRRATAAGRVGVWDWTFATGEIYIDLVLKRLLGYEDHEIRNHIDDWGRLVHPDDAQRVSEQVQAHIRGELASYEIEHRMLHRDGSVRWFLGRGQVSRDDTGAAVSMTGTGTDITERKHREAELERAEQLNRQFVECSGDCVKLLTPDGRLRYMNAEGVRALGLPNMSGLLNRAMPEFFEGAVRTAAEQAVAVARGGGRGRFQYSIQTAKGQTMWWDAVITPMTDAFGTVTQLLAISRDISERRRGEALQVGQHEVLAMIGAGSSLSHVLDRVVRLVESQLHGRCSVLLLDEDGMTTRHGAAPSLPADYVKAIDGAAIGPKAGSCGTAMHTGTRVIVTDIDTDPLWEDYRGLAQRFGLRACWSTPIFSPQRRVLGAFAVYHDEPCEPDEADLRLIDAAADITRIAIEQQRAQQALRDSEARNTAILRAIPDWMFLTTVDGVFLDFHAKDLSKLHASPVDFLGRSLTAVLPPPVASALMQAFARVLASDGMEKVEYALGHDGEDRFYEARIVRCNGDQILSIVKDVTELRRAEFQADVQRRELAHLGRISTLGELAGTLTHELSQPLAAVLTNAQVARRAVDHSTLDLDELRETLDDIIRDDRRAAAVIDRLRALLRKEETALELVDVSEVSREVLDLAAGEFMSRRIIVKSSLAPGAAPTLGDRVQLQQVLLNLVLNSCEAMNGTPVSDRELTVSTRVDGDMVSLVVSDRGSGIPEGQLERVFEPFVTFRKQGLGLGLAISRSIVAAHGGSIRAENNSDGGATFRCRLPIADAQTS